jgi:DNA gyrase subunit A
MSLKSDFVKYIADLVNGKKITGISDIKDESSKRDGMRIVIHVRRDANAKCIAQQTLYKMTALQSSFSVNNVALVNGRPQLLNLRDT